ncbi:MAG: phosphate ABC transporter substrate-binding protein [Thalassotalea sp.]
MNILKSTLALTLCFVSTIAIADIAIIVNPSNNNTISESDISRIFLGKNKSFASGDSIKAVNLKSGDDLRTEFEKKALGKSGKQVKAYWSKLIFSGKAKPLVESGSDEEALQFVADNPDAIAYIDASKVNESVKVVKIFK